jgi:hypothetical protein
VRPMSALGQKRTLRYFATVSALPLKADICQCNCDVCFGPKADSCTAATSSLIRLLRRRQKRCSRGALQFDPSVMALAVAAALGAIVAVGSSRSTAKEARHELTAAEAKRTALIGQIDLRLVPGLAAWDCKALRPLGTSRILPGAGETRATRNGRSQRLVRQLP